MKTRVVMPENKLDEMDFEQSVRPKHFNEFVGQDKIKENLKVFIQAAGERNEPLDHVLFSGPPGLGKTTLAHIIANEMGGDIRVSSGPALVKAGDLVGILSGLKQGDILFIDEIHRLTRVVEEYLYPAMEDFAIDIIIDSGPGARSVNLKLKHFTLIGATTRTGMITSPMRTRFGMNFRLDYYDPPELVQIIKRTADILKVDIGNNAALEIGKRSRGTPRIANRLLRRARDFAQVGRKNTIDLKIVEETLERLGVDELGLDEMDKRILTNMVENYNGGPVGIKTVAVSVGEEAETIEEVYEPFLIRIGFLQRTERGRVVTQKAYQHLKIKPGNPSVQQSLFE
ncbi:MAG: Holliday junction branch migration DNA helicase RuvB [bacterium]